MRVSITDLALQQIRHAVGTRPPESGGAMMGPRGSGLVTRFLFDEEADITGASYVPSRWLEAEVVRLESANSGLRLKGMLHSHPGKMNYPSTTDARSFDDYLTTNRALEYLTAVICTFGRRDCGFNEIAMDGGLILSFFTATRTGTEATVRPARPQVLPLGRLLQAIADRGLACTSPTEVVAEEVGLISFEVTNAGHPVALLSLTETFPVSPPVVYRTSGPAVHPWAIEWNLTSSETERITTLATTLATTTDHREPPKTLGAESHTVTAPQVTRPQPPTRTNLKSRPSPAHCVLNFIAKMRRRPQQGDLFARTDGFLDERLSDERILILGCGSVGSTVAMQLARSGIERFVLIDSDAVEPPNVGRSMYFASDVGFPKVDALSRHLRRVNPRVRVERVRNLLQDLDVTRLQALIEASDVVIGAADDPQAQSTLAHFAYQFDRHGVFVGLYGRASGGEIVLSVPGKACFNCAMRFRIEGRGPDQGPRQVDYGTGRLSAEPGLYPDISVVSDFAAKIALAFSSHLPEDSDLISSFRVPVIERDLTFILVGTSPGFMDFDSPRLLGEAPAQHALQSMWIRVPRNRGCSTCGEERGSLERIATPSAAELSDRLTSGP